MNCEQPVGWFFRVKRRAVQTKKLTTVSDMEPIPSARRAMQPLSWLKGYLDNSNSKLGLD